MLHVPPAKVTVSFRSSPSSSTRITVPTPEPAYMLNRPRMEKDIAIMAARHGADILVRATVTGLGFSPEGCIKELSMAKVELPSSMVRDAIAQAMEELSARDLLMLEAGTAIGMTKRGQELLEIEPVSDTLACKCEVELVEE